MTIKYSNRTKKELHAELIDCARLGDIECIRGVLQCKVDVNYIDPRGSFPLSAAISSAQWDAADILLEHKAEIDRQDHNGNTVLLRMIAAGNIQATRYCLLNRADPNKCGESGTTPVLMATVIGSISLIDLLLEHGADPNVTSHDNWTALLVAMKGDWYTFAGERFDVPEESREDIAIRLIEVGADFDAISRQGEGTALLTAVDRRWENLAKIILDRGADPNERSQGRDALFQAVTTQNRELTGLLLEYGADPNRRQHIDIDTPTSLGQAILNDDASIVKLLFDHGARPTNLTTDGRGARSLASSQGSQDVLNTILANERGAPDERIPNTPSRRAHKMSELDDPVLAAARGGEPGSLSTLLDAGYDPDRIDQETGYTPLHWAIEAHCPECVKILLNHGARVNRKTRKKLTPLMIAAHQEPEVPDIVQLLLEHGANVNYRAPSIGDAYRGGAVEQALYRSNYKSLRLLLETGVRLRPSFFRPTAGQIGRILDSGKGDPNFIQAILKQNISQHPLELLRHHYRKDKRRRRVADLIAAGIMVFFIAAGAEFMFGLVIALIGRALLLYLPRKRQTTKIKPLTNKVLRKFRESGGNGGPSGEGAAPLQT